MGRIDETLMAAAIGKQATVHDILDLRPVHHMQLTLDQDPTFEHGDDLPPFWHYLYFNPKVRSSELGPDGHERLGRFIPDFGFRRRMWAQGRIEIRRPFRLGETVSKTTTITSITPKQGRSGPLCFVTLEHRFSTGETLCFTETQTVVYRDIPDPGTEGPKGTPVPTGADWRREVMPDRVFLFRYSALIFYGHRIHYDQKYVHEVEGYPGLLVHGPLTATLLTNFGMEHAANRVLKQIDIRAMSPLFADVPFWLEGRQAGDDIEVWARTPQDALAMTVTLRFAP